MTNESLESFGNKHSAREEMGKGSEGKRKASAKKRKTGEKRLEVKLKERNLMK